MLPFFQAFLFINSKPRLINRHKVTKLEIITPLTEAIAGNIFSPNSIHACIANIIARPTKRPVPVISRFAPSTCPEAG